MRRIDLNVDIGEGAPFDADLLRYATSANISCGEHAGSWDLTEKTVELCRSLGVRVGVHPGYPDRAGFGRVSPEAAVAEVWFASVEAQVERFLGEFGAAYIKPHGACYNDSARGEPLAARALTHLLARFGLPLMGLASGGDPDGPAHARIASEAGVPFLSEGFADRAYDDRGFLRPRSEPGSVLHDQELSSEQALSLASRCDSLCVHGDTPGCVEYLRSLRDTLVGQGFEVSCC